MSLDRLLDDVDTALIGMSESVQRLLTVVTVFLPVFIVALIVLAVLLLALFFVSIFLQFKRLRSVAREQKCLRNCCMRGGGVPPPLPQLIGAPLQKIETQLLSSPPPPQQIVVVSEPTEHQRAEVTTESSKSFRQFSPPSVSQNLQQQQRRHLPPFTRLNGQGASEERWKLKEDEIESID